ncbi:MAG TPA: hypothetical protein VG013_14300 [Gemmataceae bacterium]|jgi:hypothetical protein|nr:hypothetical protein [Gemmataceae bacterium]
MLRHIGLWSVLLFVSGPICAEELPATAPEQILSADSVLYLRWDGLDTHRRAYEATALGEVMSGDLGGFIDYGVTTLKDAVGPTLAKQLLLQGASADKVKQLSLGFKRLPDTLGYLSRQGLVVGVELIELKTPRVQITVVFPNGAESKEHKTILAGLRLISALAETPVTERNSQGRTLFELDRKALEQYQAAWWQEGRHIVFTWGTEGPAHTLAVIRHKRPSLATNPLFQSVTDFKAYETVARGYVDGARIRTLVRAHDKAAGKALDRLGFGSFKALTLHFGFEGRNERSTIVLHVPGRRRGLLGPATAPPGLDLGRLPPLPPDATMVQVFQFDPGPLYDSLVRAAEDIAAAAAPGGKTLVRAALRQLDRALGIDVRQDLIGSLGPVTTVFTSPSDGVMSLGLGVAVQVKDAARLEAALKALFKSLPAALHTDISVKTQKYRGGEIHIIHVAEEGFFIAPSWTVHKGWLVIGLYPQPVQGFILRAGGKHAVWKPTPLMEQVLARVDKETPHSRIISASVSDPRPFLKQLCSLGPVLAGLADSFPAAGFNIDVAKIPNSQAVTEPLFPNVSILLDDGDALRWETHASMSLPFLEMAGADVPLLLLLAAEGLF